MTRLQFAGLMPYPPEDRLDDWGLTPEQQARRARARGCRAVRPRSAPPACRPSPRHVAAGASPLCPRPRPNAGDARRAVQAAAGGPRLLAQGGPRCARRPARGRARRRRSNGRWGVCACAFTTASSPSNRCIDAASLPAPPPRPTQRNCPRPCRLLHPAALHARPQLRPRQGVQDVVRQPGVAAGVCGGRHPGLLFLPREGAVPHGLREGGPEGGSGAEELAWQLGAGWQPGGGLGGSWGVQWQPGGALGGLGLGRGALVAAMLRAADEAARRSFGSWLGQLQRACKPGEACPVSAPAAGRRRWIGAGALVLRASSAGAHPAPFQRPALPTAPGLPQNRQAGEGERVWVPAARRRGRSRTTHPMPLGWTCVFLPPLSTPNPSEIELLNHQRPRFPQI